VASPAPAEAVAAGLREGDLIVAVNGLGPTRMMEALSAAATGRVELSIVRGAGERVTLTLAARSPA
jgi:S1-C subfamily serine protease